VFQLIDQIAERIRSLGHYAPATLSDYLEFTNVNEISRGGTDSISFIKLLLEDHESIIVHLRERINHLANQLKDIGTSDFITGVMERHEKMAWMLRAHLNQA
jgi:starvation-inducible DNA-binding protein